MITEEELEKILESAETATEDVTDVEAGDTDLEDEFEEDLTLLEHLQAAVSLLRDCNVLFEFLKNPDFCKNLTQKERKVMGLQVDRIKDAIAEFEEAIEDSEEEEQDE